MNNRLNVVIERKPGRKRWFGCCVFALLVTCLFVCLFNTKYVSSHFTIHVSDYGQIPGPFSSLFYKVPNNGENSLGLSEQCYYNYVLYAILYADVFSICH